jgi:hypothetical protein
MYFISDETGSWIAIKKIERLENILKKLSSIDIIVSDLDDTDAYSSAFRIGIRLVNRYFLQKPCIRSWCISQAVHVLEGSFDKDAAGQEFLHEVFSDGCMRKDAEMACSPAFIASKLFPGIQDFYRQFHVPKVYLTRNIPCIAQQYEAFLGLEFGLYNQCDKEKGIADIIQKYPFKRNYLIKENNPSDGIDICGYLREMELFGAIDSFVSVFVVKNKSSVNPEFDINISRDYRLLNKAIMDSSQDLKISKSILSR